MSGVIFTYTLRRGWKTMLMWSIFLLIYGFYITAFISDVSILQQYASLIETMPRAMLQAFGVSEDASFMASPEGFISFGYSGYILLILAIYAVSAGLNVTANEEDQGITDMLLSLPLPRWRLIVEKSAAYIILMTVTVLAGFVGLWAGLQTSPVEVSLGRLLEANLNILPSLLLIFAMTVFLAGVFSNKNTVTAAAAGFVIVSYFLNVVGQATSGSVAGEIARLSVFYYYDHNNVMLRGLSLVNVAGILALGVALIAGAVWFFQRRDVGI